MGIGKQWWRNSAASGSAASALSALVASALSERRLRAPLAALNAVSHWIYGPSAYRVDRPSLRFTLPGILIHHASSLFWGALYQLLLRGVVGRSAGEDDDRPIERGHPTAVDRCAAAGVVTAIAAFTDLRLVPPRLSPGFEHRLSKTGVALVYLGFACGLALASHPNRGWRPKRLGDRARCMPKRRLDPAPPRSQRSRGPTLKGTPMLSTRTTCTIALATALSMPCFAQSTSGSDTSGTTGTAGTTSGMTTSNAARNDSREGHGNWGWIGLLGLAGLLGLRRPSDTGTRVDTTRTSTQR